MMAVFKKLVFAISFISIIQFSALAAEEVHDHDEHAEEKKDHSKDHKGKKNDKHDDHADHDEEKSDSHADHDDESVHGEKVESNPQVGENKGIVEANKEKGFKLSPEAEKNFAVKKIKIKSSSSIELPLSAIATSTVEVNVYRFRDGFYKRIDFNQISKNQEKIFIKSLDLKEGDEVAISGLGFLRVSEIAAFDGAPEGHSH